MDTFDTMHDNDPQETQEWLDAIESVLKYESENRAAFILNSLIKHLKTKGAQLPSIINTPYCNTISPEKESTMPGDLFMERKIRSIIRWNAMAMVMRANLNDSSLGGHISSFASSATLYDVGFNHFFHGRNQDREADLIYYQGHASPGIYARAYLEGRISEKQMNNFRQETNGEGLSSYPHPWLMPDFWQFPTVSMGLGPLQAIYQAQFMKYLINRKLMPEQNRKIWAFLGDGEMDEPESLGAISLAGREQLDNLIFVINCNLQRLDGPVRGNGKIIQELEGVFKGAGWNIIKVIWGRKWDPLFAKDHEGHLQKIMDNAVDGLYQNCKAKGGKWTRENFFGQTKETLKLVENMTDEDIYQLNRGGHDPYKIFAAYHEAVNTKGKPTVILAKTIKGYGTGESGEAINISHNVKKLSLESLKQFRDRFNIPIDDQNLEKLPFYRPDENSTEMKYLKARRQKLGGYLPERRKVCDIKLPMPELKTFESITQGSGERAISTTMAFVRLLGLLAKDKNIGQYIVPIIPDEARTFGMEGMFRQLGIYASTGQKYEPVDSEQMLFYKESKQGQILEQGITEAGSHASWIAAATAYSVHNVPTIPIYMFYSMFGFQRTGDLAWAAGDSRAKGFLIGATSGRTTLNGEGLQHEDGHSHILASTVPNCVSYDPAYAYEIAIIVQDGLRRMYTNDEDIWYYITTTNENYIHPAMPSDPLVIEGVKKGLYCLEDNTKRTKDKEPLVQLMGCGAILGEVIAAADILRLDYDIESNIWSVTSFNELRRDGITTKRWNMIHPSEPEKISWTEQQLSKYNGPFIAATDYMKIFADQIRDFVPGTYITLGTDGFGRSDTRAQLRSFFEVDRNYIVIAALYGLVKDDKIAMSVLEKAIKKLKIDTEKLDAMYS